MPHIKQTFRLDAELVRLVAERARQRRVTRTEIVEAALASLLSADHEERLEAALTRRIDKLARGVDRLEWNIDLANEAFALFVRFWLTSTPPLPDAAGPAAQATGKKRWEGFVDSLSRRMEGGPRLADELSRDISPDAHSAPSSK
jgi:predicted transcriptional regulator